MTKWEPYLDPASSTPLYWAIVESLAAAIDAGELEAGDRLPTHRGLAERLDVTVGTVSRAYAEAERRGLVLGEVGRGTFVRRDARPDGWYANDRMNGAGLLDLGRNFPVALDDEEGAAFARVLERMAGSAELAGWLRYAEESGTLRQRAAGAMWIARTGLEVPAERVLVTAGAQHALTVALATLARPGDLVLTERLTYPGIKALAQMLDLRLAGLPIDDHGLDPEAFERACRSEPVRALYTIPTIQNPTTSVLPDDRRREIAAIAEAHGVLVLEDDIHAGLLAEPPAPIAAHALETTVYVASTAKCMAPGLRVGFMLAPERLVPRLEAGVRSTLWMPVPLTVEIAADWILDGTAERLLETRRERTAARQRRAGEALAGFEHAAHPDGSHLWLDLPEPWRGADFVAQAGQRGVLVTGADAFAVGREAPPHAVRLALGAVRTVGDLDRALAIVVELLEGRADPCLPCV